MAFDRAVPAPHAELTSQMFRDQFTGLDDKINAVATPATPTLGQVLTAGNDAGSQEATVGTLFVHRIEVPGSGPVEYGNGKLTGNLDANGGAITNLADPANPQDADTQGARDAALAALHTLAAPTTAPTLVNSQLGFHVDEPGNQLVITVKYSDGTTKSVTLALV